MTAPNLGPSFNLQAFAKITGATGTRADVVNITNSVRNAQGDYTITIGTALDATQRSVALQVRGAADGKAVEDPTGETDNTINVLTFDTAGAAADIDFSITVFRTSLPA